MNGIKYLLDTNVIIGMYRRNQTVIDMMRCRQVSIRECGYSAITRMELLSFPAITTDEEATIKNLLDRMMYFSLTTDIENSAIQFRRQHKTKLPDAVIAATAMQLKLELLTLDKGLLSKL